MKQTGFSLIELMVVLAVIAALATVAIPSYQNYSMRADRSDGLESLQAFFNAQERYYADNMTYTANLTDLGATNNTFDTPRGNYQITAGRCGNQALTQCVQLTATAVGPQAKDGDLIFNSNGRQVRVLNGTEHAIK